MPFSSFDFNRRVALKTGVAAFFDPSQTGHLWAIEPFGGIDRGFLYTRYSRRCRKDFISTDDLTKGGEFDFSGVHKHVWFGQAADFRGTDTVANSVADQCMQIIFEGKSPRRIREYLVQACRSYFASASLKRESLAIVMVNVGHLRYARSFAKYGLKYTKALDYVDVVTNPRQLHVAQLPVPTLTNPLTSLDRPFPWQFANCHDDPDARLWTREISKYFTQHGVDDYFPESMFQVGPGRATFQEYESVQDNHEGYFENTRPLREQTDGLGFTDTIGINLIRISHEDRIPVVHHLIFNLNGGILRGKQIRGVENRPDQILNYEYSETTLHRFMMIYEDMFELIRSTISHRAI
ncbi:hypothetical protein RISK_005274 [Rhodopirellula islandica]|uniref:Uncharacterized protein n=1 Tax=Rhodopirellula islandica TaxID=595434 RepID=A0A0J1B6I9_RHOIS|nr:hypothetical protein [Rhodopirellula islandica]KLU02208.1 hypothetical protein RISK_005274 [Rhodopirellula islandica]